MNDVKPIRPHQERILINEQYLESLIAAIHEATYTIDLEVYIFEQDAVGKKVADALCAARKRGVQIRVLVDGVGSLTWGGAVTQQLEQAGIKTKVFHPLPWKISHLRRSFITKNYFFTKIFYLLLHMNSRNHRKVCIIDQQIVFVGSANIHDCLIGGDAASPWRETSVKVTGINIDELQYAFNKAWGGMPLRARIRHAWQKLSDTVFHLNYSWRLRHRFYRGLLKQIAQCKKRIWVTNAYFVPDEVLLKRLIHASRRGVDVRILLPEKSDVAIISMVTTTFYGALLESDVFIYRYTPSILHAKTLILDDFYLVGSSNLNYRSLRHDLEVDAVIKTDEAKHELDKHFFYDLSQSRRFPLSELKKQPFYKKIMAHIILLIKYWI